VLGLLFALSDWFTRSHPIYSSFNSTRKSAHFHLCFAKHVGSENLASPPPSSLCFCSIPLPLLPQALHITSYINRCALSFFLCPVHWWLVLSGKPSCWVASRQRVELSLPVQVGAWRLPHPSGLSLSPSLIPFPSPPSCSHF
jgi:hypothetical protein